MDKPSKRPQPEHEAEAGLQPITSCRYPSIGSGDVAMDQMCIIDALLVLLHLDCEANVVRHR